MALGPGHDSLGDGRRDFGPHCERCELGTTGENGGEDSEYER